MGIVNPIGAFGNRIVGLILSLRVAAAERKHDRQHPVMARKTPKLSSKVYPSQLVIKPDLLNTLSTHKRSFDFHRCPEVILHLRDRVGPSLAPANFAAREMGGPFHIRILL